MQVRIPERRHQLNLFLESLQLLYKLFMGLDLLSLAPIRYESRLLP